MTLAIATVMDSISKLSVSGLVIKDMDEIPATADEGVHTIFPEPLNLVTNFDAQKASFGEGAGGSWNVEYDLNYTFCYAPIGSGRGLELFSPTIVMAFAFLSAIMECNPQAGAVLLRPGDLTNVGPIPDPSGKQFYGCSISVHVLEFVH